MHGASLNCSGKVGSSLKGPPSSIKTPLVLLPLSSPTSPPHFNIKAVVQQKQALQFHAVSLSSSLFPEVFRVNVRLWGIRALPGVAEQKWRRRLQRWRAMTAGTSERRSSEPRRGIASRKPLWFFFFPARCCSNSRVWVAAPKWSSDHWGAWWLYHQPWLQGAPSLWTSYFKIQSVILLNLQPWSRWILISWSND